MVTNEALEDNFGTEGTVVKEVEDEIEEDDIFDSDEDYYPYTILPFLNFHLPYLFLINFCSICFGSFCFLKCPTTSS